MIRQAKIREAGILTRISFDSKGYWGYPKEYFQIWADELTISAGDIQNNDVWVYEDGGRIVGYYSLVELKDDIEISGVRLPQGFWLEHMFVEPGSIGNGIGTKMFDHLQKRCRLRGIKKLSILADPNSRGFYEKMGCEYRRQYPSTIRNRTTPLLQLNIRDSEED